MNILQIYGSSLYFLDLEMFNICKLDIPKVDEIIDEAVKNILRKHNKKFEIKSFSEIVNKP